MKQQWAQAARHWLDAKKQRAQAGWRWLGANKTLNSAIFTSLLPPFFFFLLATWLGSWLLPGILQDNARESEFLRQRGQMELQAVREIHSLTREFLKVHLEYDDQVQKCTAAPPTADCLEKQRTALLEFARRWDEGAGFFAIVLGAYLERPDTSPEARHLQSMLQLVDRKITCPFSRSSPAPIDCALTQVEIDRLEVNFYCFSQALLQGARRHSEGLESKPTTNDCG